MNWQAVEAIGVWVVGVGALTYTIKAVWRRVRFWWLRQVLQETEDVYRLWKIGILDSKQYDDRTYSPVGSNLQNVFIERFNNENNGHEIFAHKFFNDDETNQDGNKDSRKK